MTPLLDDLNLKAWPFQVVPDGDFAKIWAGRSRTKEQVYRLLSRMQLSQKSGMRVLWANFGMGKTHTLLHIKHLCSQTGSVLIPVYVVMPNRPVAFLDIYRAIVSELPFELLGEQLVKVGAQAPGGVALHPLFARAPGLVNALLAMRSGEIERSSAARQWIVGQPGLSTRDLHTIPVNYRIKTAEDAIQALTALTRLATFNARTPSKLVVLFDEYQRIGELKAKSRAEINAGVHGYFNANPTGLEIFLSFSFGRRADVGFLLSDELKSRAEPDSLSLDTLSRADALEFFRDLLTQFRLRLNDRWAYPFSVQALEAVVDHIAKSKGLTPRRLMHYGNYMLEKSLYAGDCADRREISVGAVRDWLAEPDLGALDADEPELAVS